METIINYIKLNYESLLNTIDIYGVILFLVLTLLLLLFNKETKIKNTLLLVIMMMLSFQLIFNNIENSSNEEKNVIYLKDKIEEVFGKIKYEEENNKNTDNNKLPSVINTFY